MNPIGYNTNGSANMAVVPISARASKPCFPVNDIDHGHGYGSGTFTP